MPGRSTPPRSSRSSCFTDASRSLRLWQLRATKTAALRAVRLPAAAAAEGRPKAAASADAFHATGARPHLAMDERVRYTTGTWRHARTTSPRVSGVQHRHGSRARLVRATATAADATTAAAGAGGGAEPRSREAFDRRQAATWDASRLVVIGQSTCVGSCLSAG